MLITFGRSSLTFPWFNMNELTSCPYYKFSNISFSVKQNLKTIQINLLLWECLVFQTRVNYFCSLLPKTIHTKFLLYFFYLFPFLLHTWFGPDSSQRMVLSPRQLAIRPRHALCPCTMDVDHLAQTVTQVGSNPFFIFF